MSSALAYLKSVSMVMSFTPVSTLASVEWSLYPSLEASSDCERPSSFLLFLIARPIFLLLINLFLF